ncbi:MAG: hypothetical protein M3R50_00370, partial [Bacteroidota bacterium]|nr:hypothetical protein [Bacteroidota bacterium]
MKNYLGRFCICLIFSAIITGPLDVKAQVTQRNLLPEFTQQQLTKSLIPQEEFKPFPQTPKGWKKILPDSVIA